MSLASLLIYFLVGILQDFLLTLNFRYVAKGQVVPAAVFSFLVTVTSLLVFYNIFNELSEHRNVIVVLVYSAGIGIGTIIGIVAEKKVSKK